jgi:hypothetical protein
VAVAVAYPTASETLVPGLLSVGLVALQPVVVVVLGLATSPAVRVLAAVAQVAAVLVVNTPAVMSPELVPVLAGKVITAVEVETLKAAHTVTVAVAAVGAL